MSSDASHIIIEFAGMPKSGKTAVLDVVGHYLKRVGWSVSEFHGGGRYAPITKEHLAELDVFLACQIVQQLLMIKSAARPANARPTIHLFDRGLLDRTIFARALTDLERTTPGHLEEILSLATLDELDGVVDCAFVFTTSVQLSLAREAENQIVGDGGRVMNRMVLSALKLAAEECVSEAPISSVAQVRHVDTEQFDRQVRDTALMVLGVVKEHVVPLRGLEIPA